MSSTTTDVVPISWRIIRVMRAGRLVSGNSRLRVLRHLREHGQLPEGHSLDPPSWGAIDFMGFDADEED